MFFKKIQLADNPFCKTLTWIVLAAFLLSTACTTTRVISRRIEPQPNTLQNELKNGDLVNVTTKKGHSYKFRIVDITSEAIIWIEYFRLPLEGRQRSFQRALLFNDIAKIEKLIEKSKFSPGKTVGAVIGVPILLLAGVVVIYVWACEQKKCWGN